MLDEEEKVYICHVQCQQIIVDVSSGKSAKQLLEIKTDKQKLSGSSTNEGIWYNQLIDGTAISSTDQLTSKINQFFIGLTSEFTSLTPGDITRFHGACIPQELFVTNWEAYRALRDIKTKKADGPDGIRSVILKLFAFELAPVVADIYNSTLCEGVIPPLLKRAIVHPLPKVTPPKSIEDDVRPISHMPAR